jgi:hypothetical protein
VVCQRGLSEPHVEIYEISTAILLFVVFHIATIYVCGVVMRMEYKVFVATTVAVGVVVAILIKGAGLVWKNKIEAALQNESRRREMGTDLLGAVVIFLGGAVVSNLMLYRLYGMGGWLGLAAANTLAGALI